MVLAGIVGALVAVPIVAVLNTGIRHLAAWQRHRPQPPPPDGRRGQELGCGQGPASRRNAACATSGFVVYQNGGSDLRR